MSKKVNPAALGIFVVGAFIILLAGLIILGAGQMFEKKKRFVLYFQGSANGLEEGSDVLLGGVKVGAVVEMRVQFDLEKNQKIVPVIVELSADRLIGLRVAESRAGAEQGLAPPTRDNILQPERIQYFVEKGLRARLKSKSALTGQLYVDLDIFPLDQDYYEFKVPEGESTLQGLQQIPTTKSEVQQVLESIAKSVDKLSKIEVGEIVTKVNEAVDEAKTLIAKVNSKVDELDVAGISDQAKSTLAKAEDLLGDEKIKGTIASIDEAAAALKDLLVAIDSEAVNGAVVDARELIKNASTTIENAGAAMKKIELAAGNIAENTASDSALTVRLNRALGAIEEVSRSAANLTDYLKRNPNSILAGRKRP